MRGELGQNYDEAILDAAPAGHGNAVLSDWPVAERLEAERLAQVLSEARTQDCSILAMCQKNQLFLATVLLDVRFLPNAPRVAALAI